MDTHKKIHYITTFPFFIFFLCSTLFAMELTEQQNNSAKFFIQKFPHMTFAKAKTAFDKIEPPIQKKIWNNLNQHKDKEIGVALYLAHLPQELQSYLLTGDHQRSEEFKSELTIKTILQLFVEKAKRKDP